MSTILARLQEASSLAGMSGIISGISLLLGGQIEAGIAAICLGVAAILRPEGRA